MDVFGTDYPTPDGTCSARLHPRHRFVRAHLAALAHLRSGGQSMVANCGYGHGYSVKEVIDTVRTVTKVNFRADYAHRRRGDAAAVVSRRDRARNPSAGHLHGRLTAIVTPLRVGNGGLRTALEPDSSGLNREDSKSAVK